MGRHGKEYVVRGIMALREFVLSLAENLSEV